MKKDLTLMNPAFMAALKEVVKTAVAEAFTDNEARSSLMTSEQIRTLFGISRTTLWRLQTEDGLKVYHLPNKRGNLYKSEDVKKLVMATNK